MNKKLLMTAIGAALVAGPMLAAHAAVTVYGKMNVGIAHVDSGSDASGTVGGDTWGVSSDASRIGFKGDEDLGGGLKAIYMFENGIFVDTGGWGTATSGAASTRDTYAGLSSTSWGSVRLGYYNSAYKTVSIPIEIFGDTVGDFTANGWTGEVRTANTIGYASPNMSGFTVEIESSRGETGLTGATTAETNPMILALKYSAGPLYVGFGYLNNDLASGNTGIDSAKKLAASYTMGDFTVVAALERQDNKGAVQTTDTNHIAVAYKMANNTFALSYTQYNAARNGAGGSDGDYDASQIALGVFHSLSKNTVLKAVYSKIDNSTLATSAGRMTSSADIGLSPATIAADKDPSALQFQISTSF